MIIENVLKETYSYITTNFNNKEQIFKDICVLANYEFKEYETNDISYDKLQNILSKINEKESIRKKNGVYYTPMDVVHFITLNTFKSSCNTLTPNNIGDINSIPNLDIIDKTVFDPTCGSGEYLIETLNIKFEILKQTNNLTKENIIKVVNTIYGNDINIESTQISKIRLFICVLHYFGYIEEITNILNHNFENKDFVSLTPNKYVINDIKPNNYVKYDIILGNPPYVEDSKSGLDLDDKYGNIYANVLVNANSLLKENGVIGFIIPLSFVSTPRMSKLRDSLDKTLKEQWILSYADRPDCLFTLVHQKLCIFIAKKNDKQIKYTSNYTYWYKEERNNLFTNTNVIKNDNVINEFIPKLGNDLDLSIFYKVYNNKQSISSLVQKDGYPIYLNMRATYWVKAFFEKQASSEYKNFNFTSKELQHYLYCIFNSSLFWWYWTCVSDGWHITNKELSTFKIVLPSSQDFENFIKLSKNLENKLEETKEYIGTVQTDYEYKHKYCLKEINEIDDYINRIYNLTNIESNYIKNFALKYRTGNKSYENNN